MGRSPPTKIGELPKPGKQRVSTVQPLAGRPTGCDVLIYCLNHRVYASSVLGGASWLNYHDIYSNYHNSRIATLFRIRFGHAIGGPSVRAAKQAQKRVLSISPALGETGETGRNLIHRLI